MPCRQLLLLFSALAILFASPGPAAADPQQARQLINALGCKGCHRLEEHGGSLAPELDKVSTRLTEKQILQFLAGQGQNPPQHKMPSYATTPAAQLKIIASYLYNLNPD